MNRRHFLSALATLPALSASSRLFAAPRAPGRFLLVFLRGGYDAASLLVPTSSDFYYEARPNIALARPSPADPNSALALADTWGLHPALRDSIWPLAQKGEAVFVPFAGTPDLSRSHFETQDSIELGLPPEGPRDYSSGFLARLVSVVTGAPPIAFTDAMPVVLKGPATVPNLSLRNVGKAPFDDRQMALLSHMYAGHHLAPMVDEGLELRKEVAQEMQQEMAPAMNGGMQKDLQKEMQAASRNAVNTRGFEAEARRIARMMNDKYRIGFVDVGGWDTHINQGAAQGALANNLQNLGQGLAAFAQEMGPAWKDTVVVVMSEFGRTFRENGNRGTDHGHGSVYWVLSGALARRGVAGEQIALTRESLFQGRDYPVLNDYRALLGELFVRMYGLNARQVAGVFPGVGAGRLQLV